MNGHTIGFHQQTQKLELLFMSPQLTLAGKGLIPRGGGGAAYRKFSKSTLRGTNLHILNPKRYDERPRHFYMEAP